MGTIIFWSLLIIVALSAFIAGPRVIPEFAKPFRIVSGLLIFAFVFGLVASGFNYAEPGFIYHVRTITGNERVINQTGWFFSGWRDPIEWKKHYTVAFVKKEEIGLGDDISGTGSSINDSYQVTMADNVRGTVNATVRFKIPEDETQFLNIAYTYRSPQRLVDTTLKQSVQTSLDATASLMGAEEYFTSGRNQFKQEFREIVQKGVPHITRKEEVVDEPKIENEPSAGPEVRGDLGDGKKIKFKVEKITDETGTILRDAHKFADFGITVTEAILAQFDADETFLKRIDQRREAAANRAVARERRLEEEQNRLLAIAKGQREVAEEQAKAKKVQIKETTNAETERQLAVIGATRQKEQAAIDKETSTIRLEQAKIDAQKIKELADANAYEKEKLLAADGALNPKLEAWKYAQAVWAEAYSKRAVPTTVFGTTGEGAGSNTDVSAFMNILTMRAAKDLQVDTTVKK